MRRSDSSDRSVSPPRRDAHGPVETVLLAVLVMISLALSRQLWFGSTLGYAIQRAPGYSLVSEAPIADVRKLVQPMNVLVHVGDDRHALVPTTDYPELWQTTVALIFDALPSFPESRELTAMTEDELAARRRRSLGVEFPLFSSVPYAVWQSVWSEHATTDTPIAEALSSTGISRVGVFLVGELEGATPPGLEFVLRTTEGLFRYDFPGAAWPQVANLIVQLHGIDTDLARRRVPAYRPVSQTFDGWQVDPDIYVPVEPPSDLPVFMVTEVSPTADQLKEWFFGDDATVHQVNDPTGGVFLQGDRQTVKANGRVEFEVIEPDESTTIGIDPLTGLRLAVGAVNRFSFELPDLSEESIDGIPARDLRLWRATRDLVRGSLEDLSKGFELRGFDFDFAEYYATYPVVSNPPTVEVGVNHRGLRYFTRVDESPVLLLSVIRSDMITAEEAIETAITYAKGRVDQPAQEDQRILKIYPAYYSSVVDPERRLLDPIWVVEFASPAYGTVYVRGNTPEVVETTNNGDKTP